VSGILARLLLTLVLITPLLKSQTMADEGTLIIATATPGGTYYLVGVAIATLIGTKLAGTHGINATARNSAGSGENLSLLREQQCDLTILQALFGHQAYSGAGPYAGQPFTDFRSITMLWENVEHFVLRGEFVRSGAIMDLKDLGGAKFAIGTRGSGTEGSGRTLLEALGIDLRQDLTVEHMDYATSAQAVADGRIAGANIPAGPPVPAVAQLFGKLGADKLVVLQFSDEQLAVIQEQFPILGRFLIPTGTYPGQEQDIRTISQPNFLACRSDLPEETVYLITKTIYENLPFLHNIHEATQAMNLERAIKGLPVPLHPGAERYFREVGVLR
jgi:uncharacterized protein